MCQRVFTLSGHAWASFIAVRFGPIAATPAV